MAEDSTLDEKATRPEVVLEATSRQSIRASLAELWNFREVLVSFTMRTLRVRYKQALLGVAWAVIQPLAFLGLFVLFFGRVAKIEGGGVPYAASALSALVPWVFVATAVSFGVNSLVADAPLVRKVFFPREAPVLGAVGATFLDLAIGLVLLFVLGPILGAEFGWSLLYIPVVVILLVVPVIGVCLPLAALNVYYRDFRYALPLATQLWLFASPVAYPVSQIPERWRSLYALLNPIVGPLEGFRRSVAYGVAPDWRLVGLSAVTGVLLLALGYWLFKSFEPEFADVV